MSGKKKVETKKFHVGKGIKKMIVGGLRWKVLQIQI